MWQSFFVTGRFSAIPYIAIDTSVNTNISLSATIDVGSFAVAKTNGDSETSLGVAHREVESAVKLHIRVQALPHARQLHLRHFAEFF